MFKYEENHLYKKSKFTPEWGGANPLDNWKINEIVNKADSYEEAYALCDEAQLEDFDTIIRENLISYFRPEIQTYGELRNNPRKD